MHMCREAEFPEQILNEMLTHEPDDVKAAILQALLNRSHLSSNLLDLTASFLREVDSNFHVRQAAIQALGQQSPLLDTILQVLISHLDHGNFKTGFQVETVLRKHDSSCSAFPHLHTQSLLGLYRIWALKAFLKQFSCYMQDGVLYIDATDRRRQIPLQKDHVFKAFLKATSEMGSLRSVLTSIWRRDVLIVLLSHYCASLFHPIIHGSCCDRRLLAMTDIREHCQKKKKKAIKTNSQALALRQVHTV